MMVTDAVCCEGMPEYVLHQVWLRDARRNRFLHELRGWACAWAGVYVASCRLMQKCVANLEAYSSAPKSWRAGVA